MKVDKVYSTGSLEYVRLKSGGYRVVRRLRVFTGRDGWSFRIFDKTSGALLATQTEDGWLTIEPGYQWDGASFIPDRKSNMRASLVHDVLYEAERRGLWPPDLRGHADQLFHDIEIVDGAWGWVAALDYAGLRTFAGFAAKRRRNGDTEPEDKILVAP